MHKILLVEDDPVIRQQVGKMLSEWGFEVVIGRRLYGSSKRYLFNLNLIWFLMDIGLPLI